MGLDQRDRTDQGPTDTNPSGGPRTRPERKVKSFEISKRLVFEAWEKVRANNGAPGVDAVSITEFANDEASNVYRLWNRTSSGSYFPGPVRAVKIPWPCANHNRYHDVLVMPTCPRSSWSSGVDVLKLLT
jgi:hypothetical protein